MIPRMIPGTNLRVQCNPVKITDVGFLIHQASGRFTDSQTRQLPTAHQSLVGEPNNAILWPLFAACRCLWAADFSNIDAIGELRVIYSGGGNETLLMPIRESVLSRLSGLLAGGGPDATNAFMQGDIRGAVLYSGTGFSGPSGLYDSDIANKGLDVAIDNGSSGDLLDGDDSELIVCAGFLVFGLTEGKCLTIAESGWNESTRTFDQVI